MLNFVQGSILDTKMDWLVAPVNCVGVAGKGLALELKKKYPEIMEYYTLLCDRNLLRPGVVGYLNYPIILFPTKKHFRNPSKLEWIDSGLADLAHLIKYFRYPEINSVAIPALGCGNGELAWSDVERFMHKYLDVFASQEEPGQQTGALSHKTIEIYLP